MQEEGIPRFSEFATDEMMLNGTKLSIESIIGKSIIVLSYRISTSKFNDSRTGRYLTIQFILNNETYVVFTGSAVLADQCKKYNDRMPFCTTIQKVNKHYTFT